MSKNNQSLRFQSNQKSTLAKTIPKGKKQRLTIERLAHDGRGIATLYNRTWFVTGALPNEEVEVSVISSQSKIVNARCEHVITSSPSRVTPPCPYAQQCGGCELQHLSYENQVNLKQTSVIDQFQRLANITIEHWHPPITSSPFEYRRRARIAVRFNEKTKHLDIGFRAAFSQQIISIDDCLVLTTPLRQLIKPLFTCLRQLNSARHIGHIELFSGNKVAILIRHTAPLSGTDIQTLITFCENQQTLLWLQGKEQPEPINPKQNLYYSLTTPTQTLSLTYRMGDFIQVNEAVNQAMVSQALNWLQLQTSDKVLDLFSGLGNFTLPIATQAEQVTAVEGVENMITLGNENAHKNQLTNAIFHQADLAQSFVDKAWSKDSFSVVLLDPPREGAFEIVKQLKNLKAMRILYISCNPATLARDTKVLIDQGYIVKKAGIMDMFPQTSHIETMVLFER